MRFIITIILACSICCFKVHFSDASIPYSALINHFTYRIYTNRMSIIKFRYTTMNRMKLYRQVYTYRSLGDQYYYFGMYSQLARLKGYYIRTTYTPTRTCANFKVNSDEDFLGYFQCPFFFEPSNYTYCCGTTDHNYCCDIASKSNPAKDPADEIEGTSVGLIIGISIGVFFLLVTVVGTIVTIVCCCSQNRSRGIVRQAPATSMITTNSGAGAVIVTQNSTGYANQQFGPPPAYSANPGQSSYPVQPTAQVYPTYQPPVYPSQPPSYSSVAPYPPTNAAYPPNDPAYPPPPTAEEPKSS